MSADDRRPPVGDGREQRWEALRDLEAWLETPMLVLAVVWLALLVAEFTVGEGPWLQVFGTAIWAVFIVDFAIRLALAPAKRAYLARNWLTALSLVVPAVRVFKIGRVVYALRAARATRGVRLVRVVTSMNRGMRTLARAMGRRGFGYVALLTVVVVFVGAAGILALERDPGRVGLPGYGAAVWWAAMMMTTMGTDYWPRTAEGRVLTLLLALYAFAVFGYVTATLATVFIGQDAERDDAELAGARAVERLRAEVAGLRDEVRALSERRRAG